jgi:hypothetical protein
MFKSCTKYKQYIAASLSINFFTYLFTSLLLVLSFIANSPQSAI